MCPPDDTHDSAANATSASDPDVPARDESRSGEERSSETFATVFCASPYAMVILDVEGRALRFNEKFERLLCCQRSDGEGAPVFDLGIAADPVDRAELQVALGRHQAIRDLAVYVQPRSGSARDCLLSAEPIRIENEP